MKNLFLLIMAALFSVVASAQKVYFIYLQSDDHSPFYVKMGSKIHSSAASGFLILPNLTDSTYTFRLGFAKSTAPEEKFSVTINENDKGYIIKNFDNGLSLFDFQDLSVIRSNEVQKDNTVYETKKDNFSAILSKAADDPSLLKVPVAKKEEPKQDPVKEAVQEKETATAKIEETKPIEKEVEKVPIQEPVAEPSKKEPAREVTQMDTSTTKQETTEITKVTDKVEKPEAVTETPSYNRSKVTRYTESSTTEGFGLVYFDRKAEGVDTIRILIPASKIKLVASPENGSPQDVQPLMEKAVPDKEEKIVSSAAIAETQAGNTASVGSVCKNIASDKDFMKLRKKMAAKENDDAMLDDARKEFRNKCFSVEQIRYLSSLFLTSAAKYQFFDAAYNYVSDKTNFSSLGSEIKDEHYTKRFKALVGE